MDKLKLLSGGLRTKGITKQSQENQPLITVVTVVRNGEETLEEKCYLTLFDVFGGYLCLLF